MEKVPRRVMVLSNMLTYPISHGHIHITSATDPLAPPDLDTGYMSDPLDVAALVWAYKKTHEIVRRMLAFIAEIGGPAIAEFGAGEMKVYTAEDDVAIEKFVRERVFTTFHPSYESPKHSLT